MVSQPVGSDEHGNSKDAAQTILQHFPWIRFWSPNGSSINLNFDGYLPDPEERYAAFINPNLVRFSDIDAKRFLVFLGEPGIGKTDALNSARVAIEEEAARSEDLIEWIELQAYSSTDQLDRDVFEGNTFQKWLACDRELHLFLDSFDECRLLIPNLAAFLITRFKRKQYPAERLRLRIACRAAEWPGALSNELSALWPKDQTGIYELAPLRRRDVRLAADQIALNPEDFLAAISKADVVPLAIRPVTLKFLLKQFAQDQRFPSRKVDLYLRGCELLAQEASATRRMAGLEGNLTPGQRFRVASRIAATSFFCNRPTILIGPDPASREARDLRIEDLVGGREGTEIHAFDVGKAQIDESLRTGLFSSRGPERLGFAHQTYGEFLAAHHLAVRQTPLDQVLPLVTQIDGDRRVIVPQLLETAAWLATMRTDLFDSLAEDNPGALLASDVGVHEADRRSKLVASLFTAIDRGLEHDVWRDFRRHYHKLMHPGLADQLRPLVGERSRNFMARRVAIEVAKQCKVQELGPDLLRLAIDDSEREELRSRAISALADCGDAASLDSIKSWILSPSSLAASDDLRGEALQLLWPRRMTADELFSALAAPKREKHIGTYQIFLCTRIVSALKVTDLPIALAWAARHPATTNSPLSVERLIDQILLKAWSHLDDRSIADAFALAAVARLKVRYSLISLTGFDDESKRLKELLNSDHDRRRLVVLALLSRLADDDDNAVTLVFGRGSLVRTSDVPWLLEQLRSAAATSQPMLARLIKLAFNPLDPAQFELVYEEAHRIDALRKEVEGFWLEIALDSPEAKALRQQYLRHLEIQQKANGQEDENTKEFDVQAYVSQQLDHFDAGDFDGWWRINQALAYQRDAAPHVIQSDLRALPGWSLIDDSTRARIVATAPAYLESGDPRTSEWLGTGNLRYEPVSGYRALRLVKIEAPEVFERLSPAVWARWTPAILTWPTFGEDEENAQREIGRIAYAQSAECVVDTAIRLIEGNELNRLAQIAFVFDLLRDAAGELLWSALLKTLRGAKLTPDQEGYLMSMLLGAGVTQARDYALQLVTIPPPTQGPARQRSLVAARELLIHADHAVWDHVWQAMNAEAEFGKEVILAVCGNALVDQPAVLGELNEDELADLFIWLEKYFPRKYDPQHDGLHEVGPRDEIISFRDNLLQRLKAKASERACAAIEKIIKTYPELNWLQVLLIDTKENSRRLEWIAPDPDVFSELLASNEKRLVRNGDELLAVIEDALSRLQKKLKAETPRARFLWDESSHKPKDESALSDYIKGALDDDLKARGVVAGRELEIYPSPRGRGASVDIHVDAITLGRGEVLDRVKTIIEVKGCWNRELKTAMKTQLVDDYLAHSDSRHGLYVVGWFGREHWDDSDYDRRQRVPFVTLDEAQRFLDVQARALSVDGRRVTAMVLDFSLP